MYVTKEDVTKKDGTKYEVADSNKSLFFLLSSFMKPQIPGCTNYPQHPSELLPPPPLDAAATFLEKKSLSYDNLEMNVVISRKNC